MWEAIFASRDPYPIEIVFRGDQSIEKKIEKKTSSGKIILINKYHPG